MLSLLASEKVVKNVYLLSHKYAREQKIDNINVLKICYQKFLQHHQPNVPVNWNSDFFVLDSENELKLQKAYTGSQLNDLNQHEIIGEQVDLENKAYFLKLMQSSYAYLVEKKPLFKLIFDLLIHTIFFRKSKKSVNGEISLGGSSSTSMGVIWFSRHKKLTKYDISEFLIHELTHHILFVSERCEAQFHYSAMVFPENYAQSAILHKKRPIDKVIHSIAVATEILIARQSFLSEKNVTIHPQSNIMKNCALGSIDSVLKLSQLEKVITPWTMALLRHCQEILKAMVIKND